MLNESLVSHLRKRIVLGKNKTEVIHSPSAEEHDFKKKDPRIVNDFHSQGAKQPRQPRQVSENLKSFRTFLTERLSNK